MSNHASRTPRHSAFAALLLLAASAGLASAQSVEIRPRVLVDSGPPDVEVQETALVATRTRRLAVCYTYQPGVGLRDLRAASALSPGTSWRAEDVVPGLEHFYGDDPALCVLDAARDRCVLFARNLTQLRYSVFEPDTGFGPWHTAATGSGFSSGIDKPWVVQRAPDDFLVFFTRFDHYEYLRSPDGATWGGTPIQITADAPVAGVPFSHPAVAADGRVFLAFPNSTFGPNGNGRIRFLAARDGPGGLEFRYLRTASGFLEVAPRLPQSEGLPLPLPARQPFKSSLVPQIACDPTDAHRLYMTWRDVAADDPDDVNVYLARFEEGDNGLWSTVSLATIAPEAIAPDGTRADQYLPYLVVDARGRLHMLWYDNRPALGSAGFSFGFDAWYAVSRDHGATFARFDLRASPAEPRPLDLSLLGTLVHYGWSSREYSGLALYEDGDATHVCATYAGTSLASPKPRHKTVIWGQEIVVR